MEHHHRPDSGLALAAEVLDLLTRLFRGPGEADCRELLGSELPELARAAGALPGEAALALASLAESASEISCEALEPLYVSLFVSRPGGVPAPPYESCWADGAGGRGRLMGPPVRRMRERIEAAGLVLDEELSEPPDHLCLELELLVHRLDAWLAAGDASDLAAARTLASDIRAWTGDFRAALEAESNAASDAEPGAELFARAARLLTAVLDQLARMDDAGSFV